MKNNAIPELIDMYSEQDLRHFREYERMIMTKEQQFYYATAHGKRWVTLRDARDVFWALDENDNINPLLNMDVSDLTPIYFHTKDDVVIRGVTKEELKKILLCFQQSAIRSYYNHGSLEMVGIAKAILSQLSASEDTILDEYSK